MTEKQTFFVTGISTEVGKTIASAVITEALGADYWKPVQAGDLDNSDTHKVQHLISNTKTFFHPNAHALTVPASPHLSAEIDGIQISAKEINRPKTNNHLVIEGAGGLLVPLNQNETIADLILPSDKVIIVSRHYLGSINHTLLTYEALKNRKLSVFGIIFSGNENKPTEDLILSKTQLPMLLRIDEEPYFDATVVRYYTDKFLENVMF
ncbi:MAG: dethiobiotin synthase [Capnocytophaga sp.]|nr:dethiobiotin synthase [Capnocytophaga sp.]